MAPSNDSSTSTAGNLLAAGLFLVTALASQWLQYHLRQKDQEDVSDMDEDSHERLHRLRLHRQRLRRQREHQQQYPQSKHYARNNNESDAWREEAEEDEGYQDDEEPVDIEVRPRVEFRDYYKLRRLEDRLSFENLRPMIQASDNITSKNTILENGHSLPLPLATSFPNGPNAAVTQQVSNSKSSSRKIKCRRRGRRVDSAVDREDEYDFLPKNCNWNHFEKYNDDDVLHGVVVPGPSPSGNYQHFQAFSHGYSHGYVNDSVEVVEESDRTTDTRREGQGETSDSSEEPQFVWTDAVREKRSSIRSSKGHGASSDTFDTADLQLQQMSTQRSTAGANQPAGGRPQRLDSQTTVPAGNISKNSKERPTAFLTSSIGKRAFLRHASSSGMQDSPPDRGWLPQRFLPSSKPSRLAQSPTRQGYVSTASSEMSVSSGPPIYDPEIQKSSHGEDLVSSSHRSARALYNAKIMPNKVVMIRHGQSMGNINEDLYSTTPDNAMPLTKLGWEQARKAGRHLKNNVLAPLESVHFIVSPYARTVETFHGIVSAWCDPDSPEFASIQNREMRLKAWYGRLLEMGLTWHEDPRIREQDFGNYQDPVLIRKAKKDRHRFGTFYYRFPHGESASDVFDRVSTFLDSLWRSFDMNRSRNYVLVTHGISIRVLLARYFRYTIHQFNILSNPRNCEMVILNHDGQGRLRLQGRYQLQLKEKKIEDEKRKNSEKVVEVDEYKFFKRLAILPQAAIRKVKIRISYNDGATKDGYLAS